MTARIDCDVLAKARILASRIVGAGIEYLSADPAGCLECGADFLQGESHARTCSVGLAEEILLELDRAEGAA